jgi:hypothetical protein
MGNCPFCGAPIGVDATVCPACGNATLTADGPKGTVDRAGGSVPGSEIPPSHGGGVDHSQPPSDEPPEGLTDTKGLDRPSVDLPDRGLSMEGPAVDMAGEAGPGMPSPGSGEPEGPPPERRTMRLQFGAFTVIVLIVIAAAAGYYLLGSDDDGGPNGNGPGPSEGLYIDPVETSVHSVWEPHPGFHLDVSILNNATGTRSLDGHDLFVTILLGTETVGQATVTVSGDLASDGIKWAPVDVGVDLTTGQVYKVTVLLRKDGGSTTVDSYQRNVTVQQS